ncbi:MAG: cardiolipin synthase [Alicyclobacillus sp.]|nr:cardiolipin synthase [Alicyclobacillus sp.]
MSWGGCAALAVGLYALNACAVCTVAAHRIHRPGEALTWTLLSVLLPGLGPVLYAWMARPARADRIPAQKPLVRTGNGAPVVQRITAPQSPATGSEEATPVLTGLGRTAHTVAAAMRRQCGVAPARGRVCVLPDGDTTFASLLTALRAAKRSIDLDYYIFRDDAIGRTLCEVLQERARAGVQVRFLRDAVGSRAFPRRAVARLQAAGVVCRQFFPPRFPWLDARLNHRDHCKIVVVDGEMAWVGGINVGEEYTGRKPGVGPWRDTHLCLTGPAVAHLQQVFEMNWSVATPERDCAHVQRHPPWPAEAATSPGRLRGAIQDAHGLPLSQTLWPWRDAWLQGVQSGPDQPVQTIRNLFFLCLTQAERTVDITTPYFVPDADILVAMKTAVLRGVQVRLLVPARCDHILVGWASRSFFRELLQAGVDIYLYSAGLLHAKVMTADGEVAVVGAANYDLRSFRLSYEVCAVAYSPPLAADLTAQFDADLKKSVPLTLAVLDSLPRWQLALDRTARLLAPLL